MVGESVELFFSYSHKDEALRDSLDIHLSNLKWQGVISSWHDRKIVAGTEWDDEIKSRLDAADIILLLISPDFIASKYCREIEIPQAMQRHEAKQAYVIPVILRPFDWHDAPFSKLQAYPQDAKPITRWDDRDEAFMSVTQGIRIAAELLLEQRRQKSKQQEAAKARYLKKVEEVMSDGEISLVGRDTLNELQKELGLTPEEVKYIEDNAFEPYKRYEENLQRYRATLNNVMKHEYPFSDETKDDLKLRQRDLGLKPEDVEQIEKPILAQAEAKYQEKLKLQGRQKQPPKIPEVETRQRFTELRPAENISVPQPVPKNVVAGSDVKVSTKVSRRNSALTGVILTLGIVGALVLVVRTSWNITPIQSVSERPSTTATPQHNIPRSEIPASRALTPDQPETATPKPQASPQLEPTKPVTLTQTKTPQLSTPNYKTATQPEPPLATGIPAQTITKDGKIVITGSPSGKQAPPTAGASDEAKSPDPSPTTTPSAPNSETPTPKTTPTPEMQALPSVIRAEVTTDGTTAYTTFTRIGDTNAYNAVDTDAQGKEMRQRKVNVTLTQNQLQLVADDQTLDTYQGNISYDRIGGGLWFNPANSQQQGTWKAEIQW